MGREHQAGSPPAAQQKECHHGLWWAGEGVLTNTDTQTQPKEQQVWLAQH